jgi:anti-sigma factor RsiW
MSNLQDDDLHAYVDSALDAEAKLRVEAWLASHPDDAERVRAWRDQNRALHAAFDPVLNEPLPVRLIAAARRPPRRVWATWRAAAGILALVGAGALGYALGQRQAVPLVADGLARDAALAHVVFTPEQKHPVEVDARHAEHLVAWLSKRLGHTLAAPDFSAQGFELLGGRLLAGDAGPVAQFMYEDARLRRVTLYVRRAVQGNDDTGFRHAKEGGVEVFYWIDRDMGYALTGGIDRDGMRRLADAAYAQLERRAEPASRPPAPEP